MNHNNPEKKEIELGEIKAVKPEEENTTVRRPDIFYSQNNVTEFFSHLDQYTMHVKSQDKLANSIPTEQHASEWHTFSIVFLYVEYMNLIHLFLLILFL